MINPRDSIVEQQKVRLDWRAYWKEFSRAHGDFPQKYKGVFLFRDGWTYAMDYPGPEWKPPEEPERLARLVRAYWVLRKRQVRQEWWEKYQELTQYKQLQSTRSLPLVHSSVWLVRDESGTPKRQRFEGPLDFPMMEMEVNRLKEEMDECERNLDGVVQSFGLASENPPSRR